MIELKITIQEMPNGSTKTNITGPLDNATKEERAVCADIISAVRTALDSGRFQITRSQGKIELKNGDKHLFDEKL